MKPAPFIYLRPASKAEALHLLHQHRDDDAKIIAGGQSLVPMMNFRMAQPEFLIDINRLDELAYVSEHDAHIAIGALTRHNDVRSHSLVQRFLPLVSEAYGHVAHHTIRNRGTIGGNVAHADSASEMPTALMTLDASFVIESANETRIVSADELFVDVFTTAIEPDELLAEIRVPKPAAGTGSAFEEVSLRKGDFAFSCVAAEIGIRAGVVHTARIGIGGIAGRAHRARAMEAALTGAAATPQAIADAADAEISGLEFTPGAGISADYRRDLTRVLLARAVQRAADTARGDAA